MLKLDTPIEYLKGVGPEKSSLLKTELGIHTCGDLLIHYPFRYVDRTKFYRIREIDSDQVQVQIKGRLGDVAQVGKGRATRLSALLADDTGVIELVWFQGANWVRRTLKSGAEYIVFGKPSNFKGRLSIPHPEIEMVGEGGTEAGAQLEPVYSTTEKLSAKWLNSKGIGRLQQVLLSNLEAALPETLSRQIVDQYKLMGRDQALRVIHFPKDVGQLEAAQRRLKFEELFFLQLEILRLKVNRHQHSHGHVFASVGHQFNTFYHQHLPFPLTEAQKRVIKEIRRDMNSGKQMNRLLQGDVGSGKTIVALITMLIGIDSGFQCVLMAPTEILANQHYETISTLLQEMDLPVALLTGTTTKKQREKLLIRLLDGEIKILIGTHALLEEDVKFANLGIAVIDEQHRFGVAQRARLWKKSAIPPHVLVMTATPIPRTLAMTLYGDLDVSVIDELPPGRKPVKTMHRFDSSRLAIFNFMRDEIAKGRQVYVVYPLIEESEKMDYKDLNDGYDSILRAFPRPGFEVSIVHGRQPAKNKDMEMDKFVRGISNILVATTVIEVGVNVPNASVMVIESAERFGLSQLHQLRGRVGRGADQSYCILMTGDKLSADSRLRMETMVRTSDGFEIAEVDLKLRGPGDLSGTQQSGEQALRIADLVRDQDTMMESRKAAESVLRSDPALILPENSVIKDHYNYLHRGKTNWSKIS